MSITLAEAEQLRFRVTYDGPSVAAGQMDARALGESLVALSELIESTASLTLGAATAVSTEVSADFEKGSFSFLVVTGIAGGHVETIARHLLGHFSLRDVLDLIGLTGNGGLIGLLKFLAGRKIKTIEPGPTPGWNVITIGDGTATIVNAQTINFYQNQTVRKHLDEIIQPLREDGITEFRTGRVSEPPTVVTTSEARAFEPPEPQGERLQDKTTTEIVQLDTLTFRSGRKWRFRMADGTTFTGALDPEFTKQVAQHDVVFGAGDALEVELRTEVFRDPTGVLSAKRDLKRVLRHIPAPKVQIPLPFDTPDSPYADEQ